MWSSIRIIRSNPGGNGLARFSTSLSACLAIFLLFTFALPLFLTPALHGQDSKQILVHYMPWFQSKPFSGQWGWHWTMNHFDPDQIVNGRPQIASHFHPLIGPYDSNDPHAIECHVQLMKLCGIGGVIIDWYGVSNFRDYAPVHRNTQLLIKVIRKAGLRYAICYEDQSIKHHVEQKRLARKDGLNMARRDFEWLDANCFSDDAYVKLDGQPLLFVFGPQYLGKYDWKLLKEKCKSVPTVLGLPHLTRETGVDGAYGWPPVHGGKLISSKDWNGYLDRLESRLAHEPTVTIAFPGFQDIYKQAKVGASYGAIEHRDGKTFEESLGRALNSKAKVIQIATWNDYGEGTNIEPTHQYGFRYLEMLKSKIPTGSKIDDEDLRLPIRLYLARKKSNSERQREVFSQLSNELLKGQAKNVATFLKSFDEK